MSFTFISLLILQQLEVFFSTELEVITVLEEKVTTISKNCCLLCHLTLYILCGSQELQILYYGGYFLSGQLIPPSQ